MRNETSSSSNNFIFLNMKVFQLLIPSSIHSLISLCFTLTHSEINVFFPLFFLTLQMPWHLSNASLNFMGPLTPRFFSVGNTMNTTRSEIGCIYKYGTVGIEESCVERTDYKLYEKFQLHRVSMLQTMCYSSPHCVYKNCNIIDI